MAEKWTNTSAPPPSTVMKPKPLSALNHFTVPCAMLNSPSENAGPPDTSSERGADGRFRAAAPLRRPFRGRPIRPAHEASWAPRDGRKQHTTYAKTGHTVPEKPVVKLPLKRNE